MESKRHNQFFDTFYRVESRKNHTPVTGLHPPPPRPPEKKKDAKKSSRLFVVIVIIYSTQDSKDSKLLV